MLCWVEHEKSFLTSGQEAIQTSRIEYVFQNDFSYFSTKSFVVGTQKPTECIQYICLNR